MKEYLKIVGGKPLSGSIALTGAKNAALPIMPVALLTEKTVSLANLPQTSDTSVLALLLSEIGVSIEVDKSLSNLMMHFKAENVKSFDAPYRLVSKMRASILVLGPMLGRYGQAKVALPGGCAIGARPIDLHIKGMEALGAVIEMDSGYLIAKVPSGRLHGATFTFPVVSVGATENMLLASVLAKGTTVLKNAAKEPEVQDLITCLKRMGAKIEGSGTDTITIEGVDNLGGCIHHILPDRIQAGSYMAAALITKGSIIMENIDHNAMIPLYDYFRKAGAKITENGKNVKLEYNGVINPVSLCTEPYPGFPTDMQAQWTSLMCFAEGNSIIEENIFENRFMLVPELRRMGADIDIISSNKINVKGLKKLNGAEVESTDLRAGFALVMAGLIAGGTTYVGNLAHIDRGYENVEENLRNLGAKVERIRLPD